jgi:hypothetical protein
MNWRRGLFRVWLVGSLCWVGYWVWLALWLAYLAPPNNIEELNWDFIGMIAAVVATPPVVTLIVGMVIVWMISGFGRN